MRIHGPAYHQLELDMRLYLTYMNLFGKLYLQGCRQGA
jgi:hypothetical protein